MFLREKRVKNKKYLYAVENCWKKGKVRQRVKKYLGRVEELPVKRSIGFERFVEDKKGQELYVFLDNNDADTIIYALVEWVLYRKGFLIRKGFAEKGKLRANLKRRMKILCKNKGVFCIKCKEGYLNNLSINMLLNAGPGQEGDIDKKEEAFRFARMFVEGGIKVPKEVFVDLFAKKFISAERENNINEEIRY